MHRSSFSNDISFMTGRSNLTPVAILHHNYMKSYHRFGHVFVMMSRRTSPLEQEKCRSCTSFSDYAKVARRKAHEESAGEVSSTTSTRTDCPLDKSELGRSSWGLLHTMAAKYPVQPTRSDQKDMSAFFSLMAKFYPCDYCAEDFQKELKSDPPQTGSQDDLSQWLCRLHNRVNNKLGKPEFDCSQVNERWRDGWADGSCD